MDIEYREEKIYNSISRYSSMKSVVIYILLIGSVCSTIYFWMKANESSRQFQNNIAEYPYLSPRILRERKNDFIFNFLDLRADLRNKVVEFNDEFALYFEYLPTGTSIAINSNREFFAASLFKLPVVMAYFRHKEKSNSKNDMKVILTEEMIDDRFGNLWKKGVGYEISLDEAAKLTLTKSDNTAANALIKAIDQEDFDDVYQGLDIDIQVASQGAIMTAKNYSSILKALYFSAVLTKEDSQQILKYLTESEFNDKLVAGVPSGVPVAHKIGVLNKDSYRDCGIVYVPNRPYLLCMIALGNEAKASERMSEISRLVYEYVSTAENAIVKN